MVPQCEKSENISVNIYETGSFTKFDERDPDTNFFDDITKSNFETSYFNSNKVKPYLQSTQYLEKLNLLKSIILELLNVIVERKLKSTILIM